MAWVATSVQRLGPRKGTSAAGVARVRFPSMLSTAARAFATTLVVVESAEGVSDAPVVVVTGGTLLVLAEMGVAIEGVVVEGGAPLFVEVGRRGVEGDVVTGDALLVLVLVLVLAGIVDVLNEDVRGRSGREFNVNTRTSNSSGLDHISRCELRIVKRRRAMVIED